MNKITVEDMAIITESITKAVLSMPREDRCEFCTTNKEDHVRHRRHHDLLDRIEKFLDRLDSFRWKTASGIIITIIGSISIAIGSLIWYQIKN